MSKIIEMEDNHTNVDKHTSQIAENPAMEGNVIKYFVILFGGGLKGLFKDGSYYLFLTN